MRDGRESTESSRIRVMTGRTSTDGAREVYIYIVYSGSLTVARLSCRLESAEILGREK